MNRAWMMVFALGMMLGLSTLAHAGIMADKPFEPSGQLSASGWSDTEGAPPPIENTVDPITGFLSNTGSLLADYGRAAGYVFESFYELLRSPMHADNMR